MPAPSYSNRSASPTVNRPTSCSNSTHAGCRESRGPLFLPLKTAPLEQRLGFQPFLREDLRRGLVVALILGVQVEQIRRRQGARNLVDHFLHLVASLGITDKRYDMLGREHVLRIFERHQFVGKDRRGRAVDVGDLDITVEQRLQRGSCLLYTSPSPRDRTRSRMPSS